LPSIFYEISEAIADPKSSVSHIAALVDKDTSLAARMLQLANSAFYGFPTRIDSILKAITLIGIRQLNTLVLGIYATEAFKNISAIFIDMQSFWKHSLACGIVARILSSYRVSQITEKFFLAGLLHDVGRLVLISSLPELAAEAFRSANRTQSILTDVEESLLGFTHAHLGGLLSEKWHFPKLLENAIRYHHRPMGPEASFEAALVHVADVVANALGTGSSGEHYVPPLDPAAWEALEMPSGVLRCIIQQADQRVSELAEIFLPHDTQLPH
jgi:HD-like signal output (HDOD) protein